MIKIYRDGNYVEIEIKGDNNLVDYHFIPFNSVKNAAAAMKSLKQMSLDDLTKWLKDYYTLMDVVGVDINEGRNG